jgi:hypothetical protein
LTGISLKYYGSIKYWENIFQANRGNLSNPERLRESQKLVLPAMQNLQAKGRRRGYQTPRSNTHQAYETKAVGNQAVVLHRAAGRYREVQKGETFFGIAKEAGLSFLTLLENNREVIGADPDFIREGVKLWIPE